MLASCPSGMCANVRGMRGAELDILSNEELARTGDMFDRVLAACVDEVKDPGPYTLKGDSLEWSDVLTCDREYLLMCIRIATYGPEFSVDVKCPNPTCETKFFWDVDLRQLEIVDLDESTIEKIARGENAFDVEQSGKVFTFKLMTGKDEREAMRHLRKNKAQIMTTALAVRVIAVDGQPMNKKQVAEFFRTYDGPMMLISGAMEDIDGGIDTDIEARCPECAGRFDLKLPLDGKEFWLRPKRSGAVKRKRRTMMSDSG